MPLVGGSTTYREVVMAVPWSRDIVVGNLMSVSTGPHHAARILGAYLSHPRFADADVFAFCEAADVDVAEMIMAFDPMNKNLAVIQRGPIGSPASALAVVYRRDRMRHVTNGLRRGTPERRAPRPFGVRTRPILAVRFAGFRLRVCHAPLRRTGLRGRYLARVRALGGVRVGDFNTRQTLGARMRPAAVLRPRRDVLAAIVPPWFIGRVVASVPGHELAGADHAGFRFRLRRRKEK